MSYGRLFDAFGSSSAWWGRQYTFNMRNVIACLCINHKQCASAFGRPSVSLMPTVCLLAASVGATLGTFVGTCAGISAGTTTDALGFLIGWYSVVHKREHRWNRQVVTGRVDRCKEAREGR
eukprot:6208945-Pleurochrysis_carterae.AAC.1